MAAPTIGRIVHYRLSAGDATAINALPGPKNEAREGDVYPALVVRTWGETAESAVQLQVFYDGAGSYWATSRREGDEPATWAWPVRVAEPV